MGEPAAATPFLSVLIPSYNGGHYLAEAIDSVLGQPCADMEVLVLDDGSVDDTLAIARAAAERDGRVRVLSHENWGAGRTRNQGMDQARGQWLLFVDSDDAVLPGFYTEAMRRFLAACLAKGIEAIVPARLEADEALARARLSTVPHEGVFPAGSDVCWSIHHEFATLLYAAPMVRREGLRFGELRPEMESIFRHQAVFLAERSLFTNDLWFAVRRDNPEQTWRRSTWCASTSTGASGDGMPIAAPRASCWRRLAGGSRSASAPWPSSASRRARAGGPWAPRRWGWGSAPRGRWGARARGARRRRGPRGGWAGRGGG